MSTSKRVRSAERTSADMDAVLKSSTVDGETRTLLAHALIHLQDWRAALPAAATYDGDRVSSSSGGSKPPRGFDVVDPTQQDRDRADFLLRHLESYSGELFDIVMRCQRRMATAKDRTLTAANMSVDPECQNHRRKADLHVYGDANSGRPTTCKGNLEEALVLCNLCYRYTLDTGTPPSEQQLRAGGKLKRPA